MATPPAPGDPVPGTVARLRAAGCVFAEDEARLLVETARTPAELAAMTGRRVAGEPLEGILGWAEFCGMRIAVQTGVFVPRRRTEYLARQAIGLLSPGGVVVDLCCGTGAVGAAIAAAVPGAELYAADIDPAAVGCARRNIASAGQVFEGDLYEPLPASLRGRVGVLAVNAPYVPTGEIAMMPPEAREYEPLVALDGGRDGVEVQRRVAAGAPRWLAPGGHLLIETSSRQAPITMAAMAGHGLIPRAANSEEFGCTVVIGELPAAP
jgi:release factor glutamine methyltransferase